MKNKYLLNVSLSFMVFVISIYLGSYILYEVQESWLKFPTCVVFSLLSMLSISLSVFNFESYWKHKEQGE